VPQDPSKRGDELGAAPTARLALTFLAYLQ
jgi:hypothetical protein